MPSRLVAPGDVLGLLAGPDAGVVGQLGRLLRRAQVVARVVDQAAERGVGELLGLDEVALAQLQRVHPDLGGQRVHGPLDGVGGLGPAGAAVGVGRRHVGEHRRAAEVVGGRDVVHAGVEERAQQRDARRDQLQVGAHVADEADPDGGELAVLVGGQLDVLDLAPALDGGLRRPRCAPRSSGRARSCFLASATQSSSSAYTLSFEPKPPPTLGATTRICCSGMPRVSAVMILRMCGICVAE